MKKIATVLFLAFTAISCGNAQSEGGEPTSYDAQSFQQQITEHPDAPIVDVRTPGEFAQGHIQNAINVDWNSNNFDVSVSKLDKSKPVYVYCLSGGRSGAAAAHMRESGFQHVFELEGGMMKWRAERLPETTTTGGQAAKTSMSVADFNKLTNTDKIVLVDFYAEWCAPCKKMKPYLDEISSEMKETVTVLRIDVDKNTELASALKIDALPTIQVYKQGEISWSTIGYVDKAEVVSHLK